MASRKLNVLVYTGTGSTLESVRHCIYSLRRLLGPNYAVNPLTESALLKEPWAPTCALLVLPGGADLGYCRVLNGAGNRGIAQYIRRGGAYLGFCAGGYYGSSRCEFEVGNPVMEVVGSRELAFFPGTCRGGAFKGFAYHSERGAKAADVKVKRGAFEESEGLPDEFKCYYNGGGVFVDAEKLAKDSGSVEVLADYAGDLAVDSGVGKAAVVYCKVGEGAAILTGPHPEFDAVNLGHQTGVPGYDELIAVLKEDEEARTLFLKGCLVKLGLEVSPGTSHVPSLSKIHLSALHPAEVGELLCSFEDIITKDSGEEYIKGDTDLFHLEKPDSRWSLTALSEALSTDFEASKRSPGRSSPDPTVSDYNKIPKRIVSHDEAWPEPKETPYFNHAVYYSSLREFRAQDPEAETWGNVLMYGEVITSTNTLLEQNHNLLSKLPTGFTLAATTQVAGRGRGANVWVAPPGSLLMSTVINHPAHLATSRPIVFLQYLAALATVEAVQSYNGALYSTLPIKIKWPNDVYVLDPKRPAHENAYVKICGILANCAYSAGNYQVVLGIGINTNNGRPTTSLDALLPLLSRQTGNKRLESFRIERLLARILTRLEVLYAEFCRDGFSRGLEERYYRYWLHTNQVVTLEGEGGVQARVKGITRDWGMLMAEEDVGASE
ncbi:biotin holocarboxylase synthetase [Collariella sp. IMI 366227]|nr:biotin holocarboxylase synthetase [Collariella sp. IMI 366227]